MNITTNERARLQQAQQQFARLMQETPESARKHRLLALANKAPGDVDPLVRALAKQSTKAIAFDERVASGREELKQIESQLRTGNFTGRGSDLKGDALKRREEVEQDIQLAMAQALALRDDKFGRAQEEAVAFYRKLDKEEARTAELRAAGEAALAARSVDPRTAEAIAAGMANRRA